MVMKTMKPIVCACTFAALALGAFGEAKTYTGATKGDWFTDANWSPSGVPTSADDVTVDGKEVRAAGSIVAASISLVNAATLQVGDIYTRTSIKTAQSSRQNVSVTVTGDFTLAGASKLYVYAGTLADISAFPEAYLYGEAYTNAMTAIWAGRNTVSVGGAFSVDGNSCVYPDNDPITGTPIAFVCGEFFLGEGSTVSTQHRGWDWLVESSSSTTPAGTWHLNQEGWHHDAWSWAFGCGHAYSIGGGYGGKGQHAGLAQDGTTYTGHKHGMAYGYACAPFLSGSPASGYRAYCVGKDDCRASGSVVVYAATALTVNGTIDATAYQNGAPPDEYSGASGGGIWLATGADDIVFGANAALAAKGARCRTNSSYNSTGGGGRVAVAQGVTSAQWQTLATGALPAGFAAYEAIPGVSVDVSSGDIISATSTPLPEDGSVCLVQSTAAKVGVTLRLAGAGTVNVAGTDYSEDVTLKIASGTTVTFSATPSAGWEFSSWMGAAMPGGCSEAVSQTITITEATTVVANFRFAAGAARTWTGGYSTDYGNGLNWSPVGAPSTNDAITFSGSSVCVTLPVSNVVSALTVTAGATVLAGDSIGHASPGELTVAHDLTVSAGATFSVSAPELADWSIFATCDGNYETLYPVLWAAATHVKIGGNLSVQGATLVSDAAPKTGVPVLFDVDGDVTVDATSKIDAQNRGWGWVAEQYADAPEGAKRLSINTAAKEKGWTFAPGPCQDYFTGGGYGGFGNSSRTAVTYAEHTYGGTYGYAFAPFLPGSPAGYLDSQMSSFTSIGHRGGGQVAIFALGDVTVDGTVDASGTHVGYSGASGGGIWLAGRSFTFGAAAQLLAYGGDTAAYGGYPPGAGGRIALSEGMTFAEIASSAAGAIPAGFLDWGVLESVSNNVRCGIQTNTGKTNVVDSGTVSYVRAASVPYPIRVKIVGAGSVQVAGETHTSDFVLNELVGTELTFLATPDEGSRFTSIYWSGPAIEAGVSYDREVALTVAGVTDLTVEMPVGVGTRTWTGAVSSYIDDRRNWDPASSISAMDALVVPTGKNVLSTNSFTAYSLTLQGTATLTSKAVAQEGWKSFAELYAHPTVLTLPGGLFLEDTAQLEVTGDAKSGASVRFDVGDFRLGEKATFNATGTGWYWFAGDCEACATQKVGGVAYRSYAPGAGNSYDVGGGYGGSHAGTKYGAAYGYAYAPFLPGAPNGIHSKLSNAGTGGGVAWVRATGTACLNGTVTADGVTASVYGAPSGGGVWITAKSLAVGPHASLAARGGSIGQTYATGPGTGGRIALGAGLSTAELDAFAAGGTPADVWTEDAITLLETDVRGGTRLSVGSDGELDRMASGTATTAYGQSQGPVVEVRSAGVLAQGVAPQYGAHAVTAGTVFTASACGVDPEDENVRYPCTGFVLADASGATVLSGPETSVTIPDGTGPYFLTWQWGAPQSRVRIAKPAHGTLTVAGETVESVYDAYVTNGVTLAFAVTPEDGYEFLAWTGDGLFGGEFAASTTLTVSRAVSLEAVLRTYAAPTTRTLVTKGGFWDAASTWDPAGVPGPGDTVVIDGLSCVLTGAVKVAALQITADGSIAASADGPAVLEVTGDMTVTDGSVRLGIEKTAWHHRLAVGGNLTLAGAAALRVTAGPLDKGFTHASGSSFVDVGGTFALAGTSRFIPISQFYDGASVKVTAGAFTVAETAEVNATGTGYGWLDSSTPPANKRCGYSYLVGGGHGGKGVHASKGAMDLTYGRTYGFRYAPVEPGAANSWYTYSQQWRGGGLVRIHARTMSVLGAIRADAAEDSSAGQKYSGAAGGGIWLTADAFAFAATTVLSAHGGESTWTSFGGGGRIAIGLGLSDVQIASLAATGRCAGTGNPENHANEKRLALFLADHPAVSAENINVSYGAYITTSREPVTITDKNILAQLPDLVGTFDYYTPRGTVFTLK